MIFKAVGLPLLLITIACIQCLNAQCINRPNFTIEPASSLSDVCFCDSNSSGPHEPKSQSLYPYITYDGKVLPNNSAVEVNYRKVIDDVTSQPVGCHTNLETCCSENDNSNWFNSIEKNPFTTDTQKYIYVKRGRKRIDLIHAGLYGQLGVHCCNIPVDMGNGCQREETICVGLYAGDSCEPIEQGIIQKPTITVDVLSEHDAQVPKLNLTCTSSGGAVRFAEWNIECIPATVTPVLGHHKNSTYSSNLIVTGMVDKVTCVHSNNLRKKSHAGLSLEDYKDKTIEPPTNVVADYNTNDIINVEWNSSVSEDDYFEYRIFYYGDDGSNGHVDVLAGEGNEGVIEGVSKCVDYKVGVMALSVYSHSEITYATNITKANRSNLDFTLNFETPSIGQCTKWTNSYAREIEELIHSWIRRRLFPEDIVFCYGEFECRKTSKMVTYQSYVHNSNLTDSIKLLIDSSTTMNLGLLQVNIK